MQTMLREEWGTALARSWDHWVDLRPGNVVGELVGAAPGQVIVTDNTTVNLYELVTAALDARPGRHVIITDHDSDRYVREGIAGQRSTELRMLPTDINEGLDPELVRAAVATDSYPSRWGRCSRWGWRRAAQQFVERLHHRAGRRRQDQACARISRLARSTRSVPLSGPTASSGDFDAGRVRDSRFTYFNAHDSVCGHQFALSSYNDKGDPATSLGIARQLVSQGNPIVMADSFSSAQNQIQPYLMQQHVLVVNGDGANALFNATQNPTAYSTGPSNAQICQLMVNSAESHGDNNVGIISDGT